MTDINGSDDYDRVNAYLQFTRSTVGYAKDGWATPKGERISYTALGLAGEVGEVANQVKKIHRDDDGRLTPERRLKILDEMGDVLWYFFRLLDECGISFWEALDENRSKLTRRLHAGTIHGDRREESSAHEDPRVGHRD